MATSFYNEDELQAIGFRTVGYGCLISRKASFYGADLMNIGDNVRIDDFCILSGHITLGNNIHISAYVALYGSMGITMEDYTGISPRSTIYSAMDDFSGEHLVGPVNPSCFTCVSGGEVIIRRYAQIAANCIVFPNLTIGEGCVVGACSMVRHSLEPWGIYYGVPAERKKERSKNMLNYINKPFRGGGKITDFVRHPYGETMILRHEKPHRTFVYFRTAGRTCTTSRLDRQVLPPGSWAVEPYAEYEPLKIGVR